ncbi:MAG: flippase [Lachnospiraceae bacterium]|nr:flippase [Lachnospiraceae bacterium]
MKNKKLVKNYIYNMFYQVLLLIAPIVTTPYISRILGVTNIGIFQFTKSVVGYFILVSTVGTTLYGQREIAYFQDDPKKRSEVFWEIEIFRIFTTFICSAIYVLLFCNSNTYSIIYRILCLEIVATAFDISWLFMGMEDFRLTVIRNSLIKLTGIICVFVFVKDKNDLWVYTLCVTAPILLGNLSLWFSVKKYLVHTHLSLHIIIKGIKSRLKHIFILFIPQIATTIYLLLDKTMLGIISSSIDQVGFYSQAQKIIQMVLTIVLSIGTVMLPTMSALYAKGDRDAILRNVKAVFRFVFFLAFGLLFGLCAIAPTFVPLFFGQGYTPVIILLIIISPVLVIISTSNVIGKQYLLPTMQQKEFTISILFGAGVNFVMNIILIPFFDAIGASIATIFAELMVTVIQCWTVRKQLPLKECFKPAIRYVICGTIMFLAIKGVERLFINNQIWGLVVMIITGIIVYVLGLFLSNDPIIKIIMSLLTLKEST